MLPARSRNRCQGFGHAITTRDREISEGQDSDEAFVTIDNRNSANLLVAEIPADIVGVPVS